MKRILLVMTILSSVNIALANNSGIGEKSNSIVEDCTKVTTCTGENCKSTSTCGDTDKKAKEGSGKTR